MVPDVEKEQRRLICYLMYYNLENTTLPMSVYHEIDFVFVKNRDRYLSVGEHGLFAISPCFPIPP